MNRKDITFILIILMLAASAYLIINVLESGVGDRVVITLDGRKYREYELGQDREIDIESAGGHNKIIISDGQVYMKDADCPDKYCVRQGKISRNNESIICLPHKLVVELVRSKDDGSVDVDSVAK